MFIAAARAIISYFNPRIFGPTYVVIGIAIDTTNWVAHVGTLRKRLGSPGTLSFILDVNTRLVGVTVIVIGLAIYPANRLIDLWAAFFNVVAFAFIDDFDASIFG